VRGYKRIWPPTYLKQVPHDGDDRSSEKDPH
jgi:hypothetical protein